MEVRIYPFGPLQANMYMVVVGKEALIIDPCVSFDSIDLEGIDVKGIFCTHAHYDHIIEADNLSRKTKSVLMAYSEEIPVMKDSIRNGSAMRFLPYSVKSHVIPLTDGAEFGPDDFLMSGSEPFLIRVIHTPGHTMGSISLFFEFSEIKKGGKILFTGDTIFAGSIGRTDLGGDMDEMKQSIAKIAAMDEDVIIYPGHGESTTVGAETLHSPFFTAAFYNDII